MGDWKIKADGKRYDNVVDLCADLVGEEFALDVAQGIIDRHLSRVKELIAALKEIRDCSNCPIVHKIIDKVIGKDDNDIRNYV